MDVREAAPPRLVLLGGRIVTTAGTSVADVLVEGGRVRAVGSGLAATPGAERVDVSGRLILPGGVDVHTHLDTPFMGTVTIDDHRSGSEAAVRGGTTSYVDFAFQQPGEAYADTIEAWAGKAAGRSVIDYGFHLAVRELRPQAATDIAAIVADGVTSLKVFMAYKGALMLSDDELARVMAIGADTGAKVCIHAEDGDTIDELTQRLAAAGRLGPAAHALARPVRTEVDAVRRAIEICRRTGCPIYFVHLSTAGAVEAVAEAQAAGLPVAGETCTHYLLLDETAYLTVDFDRAAAHVVSPPLRGDSDRAALWQGLREGVLGVVSSDHCPFCFDQKRLGRDDMRLIPNGAPGIRERMILLYDRGVRDGRISLEQFVRITAEGPARLFGLHPRKGVLAPGADADIVVLDPDGRTVLLDADGGRPGHSLFDRWHLRGRVERVYVAGRLAALDGRVVASRVSGGFLHRSP